MGCEVISGGSPRFFYNYSLIYLFLMCFLYFIKFILTYMGEIATQKRLENTVLMISMCNVNLNFGVSERYHVARAKG